MHSSGRSSVCHVWDSCLDLPLAVLSLWDYVVGPIILPTKLYPTGATLGVQGGSKI